MLLTSECVLTKDENGWTAQFPQFDWVATSGRTREEAVKNAREVLSLEAFDLMDEGAPAPRIRHMAEVVLVSVDVSAEDAERSKYETKAQAADLLEVSRPRITALIETGILRTKEFNGKEMVLIEDVERYRTSPRKAGRPSTRDHKLAVA